MPVEFRKIINQTQFHHPLKDFALTTVPSEIRFDPLTGQTVRIMSFRSMKLERHDWTPFVEESRQKFCPFCPPKMEKVTPRFPENIVPGGRLRVGQAVVVPNLTPYELYSAVAIMSPEHYLSMPALTTEIIANSLRAALEFLKLAEAADPAGARYGSINWNYMPYSGGSLIHPHLQILCGPAPCRYDAGLIHCSKEYLRQNGRNYWSDLIETEKENDERYLGRAGNTHWLATFAPRALCDVTAVLPEKTTIHDFTTRDIEDLSAGLRKVINFYDEINIASFNAALYVARREDEGFWVFARIVGRYTIFPLVGSDYSHLQVMHDEPWTLHMPEELTRQLKSRFN